MSKATKVFSLEEVSKHNKPSDCWIVIEGKVYDVTKFAALHPGGTKLLHNHGGKDVTHEFNTLHNAVVVLQKYDEKLCIGVVGSDLVGQVKAKGKDKKDSVVPFGDPYWYGTRFTSPYYKETHHKFREKVRAFVDKELIPYVHEWDEAGTYPTELHDKAYKEGLYAAIWPKEFGGTPPEGLDMFHDLILVDELSRCAAGGILWAVFFSFGIALPPILEHGSKFLIDKVAKDVVTGKKIMSLAVTEAYGGSDVAGLKTTARREGDYYIVNGSKKFITSGMRATYFTTAVRTGGAGIGGISLLLLEKGMPGFEIRRQKTQGWWISGTTYLTFENVKVPVANLIGKENEGFKYIMHNFNHERYVLSAMSNRYSRVCLEESIKYARLRKTFGRRLIDHQVIRHKIAEMARQVEGAHAWLEQVAYQMNTGVSNQDIGGTIALLKVHCTKTMEFCAREASQILGGASYIRGGTGEKVERLYREVRVNAIGGGSEEIMMDLAMKQAKL